MRFLLVDDEPQVGRVIGRVAEGCGFEVEVTTRAEAFKAAYELSPPDVIGLDLAIPDCDGIELLRYLGEAHCEAQIVIVSGFDDKMLAAARHLGEARGLKMVGILSKPMRVAEVRTLLDKVRETLFTT